MGFGTKLRLAQVTGSLGDAAGDISIDGKLVGVATGSITAGDIGDVLGYLAAGIQKIHGAGSWSEGDLGTIHNDLTFKDDKKLKFGDNGDATLEYDENGDDVLQIAGSHVRIGHGANTQLQFRDNAIHLASADDGVLDITADTRIDLNAVTDVTNATESSSTSTGALTVDGGLGVAKDVYVGDDLYLKSDSSRFAMGAGDDFQIEHDGSTGATIVATGSLEVEAGGGHLTLEGGSTAHDVIVVSGRDLHLQTDDTSRLSIGDSLLSSSVAFNVAIGTEASSTQTGALIVDGGAGIAKDLYVGDDLRLTSDSARFALGAGTDVLFAHDGSTGLDLSVTGSLDLLAAGDSTFKATAGKVALSGSSGADSVHVQADATFDNDVLVTGNLTVNGTTTTLDTTNLLVEDPIVVLNKDNSSANGQGGIAIERGGSSLDMVFGRVGNDTWGVGVKDTSGGSVTTLADMALTKLRASHLEVGSTSDFINIDSADFAVTASANFVVNAGGDIKLDADGGDIEFLDAGKSLLKITNSSDDVVFRAQESNKDLIFQAQGGAEVMRIHSEQAMLMATNKEIRFRDSGLHIFSPVDGTLTVSSDGTDVSGSLLLKSAGGIGLRGGDQNDSIFVENSPLLLEAISEPTVTANKLYNVGGGLFWNGLDVSGLNEKGILNIVGTIASGSAIELNGTTTGATNIFPGSGNGLSIVGMESPIRDIDVFVNGQLLLSGTDSQVGLGQSDYLFHSTGSLKFGFSVEPGDKVQVIKRRRSSTAV